MSWLTDGRERSISVDESRVVLRGRVGRELASVVECCEQGDWDGDERRHACAFNRADGPDDDVNTLGIRYLLDLEGLAKASGRGADYFWPGLLAAGIEIDDQVVSIDYHELDEVPRPFIRATPKREIHPVLDYRPPPDAEA